MSEKWTMEELNKMSEIDFAITILNERAIKVNPYTPLGQKISKTIAKLQSLK